MTSKRPVIGTIAVIVLVVVVAVGAISASAGTSNSQSGGATLVGTWITSVDRPGLPPLKSLQSYSKGNTVVEIANGGTAVRSPSHGAWKHIGGGKYGIHGCVLPLRPGQRGVSGHAQAEARARSGRDGQSFTGVAIAELRDAAGNLLPGSNTARTR